MTPPPEHPVDRHALPTPQVIGSVSYTPSRRQIPGLLGLLTADDEGLAADVERALLRQPTAAFELAVKRLGDTEGPKRGRLCKLVGRLVDEGRQGSGADLTPWLRDQDPAVRRAAARAIGKRWRSPPEERSTLEDALIKALEAEQDKRLRAALIEAIGRVGGPAGQTLLEGLEHSGEEGEALEKAKLLLRRNLTATHAQTRRRGALEVRGEGEEGVWVVGCRRGLEGVLGEEVRSAGGFVVGQGIAEVLVRRPATATLAEGWRWRVATGFGVLLGTSRLEGAGEEEVSARLSEMLAGAPAKRILGGAGAGELVRYRLSWEGLGGKRRGATQRCVRDLARSVPWLVNDSSVRDWEVVVGVGQGEMRVKLVPRLFDPRFVYRTGDIPAASHPSLAAALVQVADPQPGEVVWDPFTGSGGEVIECGLRVAAKGGVLRGLTGSDLSQEALDVAAKNAASAGVEARFVREDALCWRPDPAPTLIVSNPPMGRRVKLADGLDAFFAQCLAHFGQVIAPGGRLVWYAPRGKAVAAQARREGWHVRRDLPVDMGGFEVHLQVLERPSQRP